MYNTKFRHAWYLRIISTRIKVCPSSEGLAAAVPTSRPTQRIAPRRNSAESCGFFCMFCLSLKQISVNLITQRQFEKCLRLWNQFCPTCQLNGIGTLLAYQSLTTLRKIIAPWRPPTAPAPVVGERPGLPSAFPGPPTDSPGRSDHSGG